MRRFCEFLEKHAMKTINFEKEKMIPLTNEGYQSYLNKINYHIFKTNFKMNELNDKNFRKVKDHCHYTGKYRDAGYSTFNSKYSLAKKISSGFSQSIKLWLTFYHKRDSKTVWRRI